VGGEGQSFQEFPKKKLGLTILSDGLRSLEFDQVEKKGSRPTPSGDGGGIDGVQNKEGRGSTWSAATGWKREKHLKGRGVGGKKDARERAEKQPLQLRYGPAAPTEKSEGKRR